MIQRALGVIAGVDRKTLSTCPPSDKLWATHLGASLCLSFVVVVGVSYHATGYMIANVWTRLLVSGVIGLTVLMFDRALCQSDWFYQGTLWNTAPIQSSIEARQTAWRFVRVGIRLLMSFGLAWVIAMFLELAIFSGTINEKIESDRIAANQPIYAKIAQYEAGLNAEAARRQASIDALEALHRDILTEAPAPEPTLQTRTDDIEQQVKALVTREADIRADISQIDRSIQRYIADMNAEEFGMKASPNNSGRPGAGPRYEYARKQKEAFIAQRAAREAEIGQLHIKRDELRAAQTKVAGEALVIRDQERGAIKAKADALQIRIDAARADLKQFEAAKAADVADFRQKALAQSYYQEKRDRIDPLTRIAAYQELKNDPKDGATMTLFSWMTRLFIIFLEIVPVVAKIFFSPPSVYAAKIQAQVERARQRIENNEDLDDDKPAAPAPAPAMATITLPTMSLDAVTMKQPEPQPKASAPEPRAARPSTAWANRSGRDDAWPNFARDLDDPRRNARRDEEEIYSRWDDERPNLQRHEYHDRDRRPAARHDFDRDDDRHDFGRRPADRRDYSARAGARQDAPSGYQAAPSYEPLHSRAAALAARDHADDEAPSGLDGHEYVPSDLDVRSLIRPRRSGPRRDTTYEADTKVNALVQEVLSVPDATCAPDAAPVAEPLRATAPDPVPAEDAMSQSASMATDQPDASLSVIDETSAEPGRSKHHQISSAELRPEPSTAPTAAAESQLPGNESRRETHPVAAIGNASPKYAADVEKLMSEAVELSKVRKKSSRPRREAPVAAQHLSEAELPLGPAPIDTLLPKTYRASSTD